MPSRFPFVNKRFTPQLLGVLLKHDFQLSAFFGHCLSCRELMQPRSHTFPERVTFHDWLTGGYENLTPSSQLRRALNGHLSSRTLHKVSRGYCWACITAWFLLVLTPASFSSLPQVLISRACPNKYPAQ